MYDNSLDSNITTEDIFKKTVEQSNKINKLSSELQELKTYKSDLNEAFEKIKEWYIMEEEEPEKYEEEKNKIWNELQEEEKE